MAMLKGRFVALLALTATVLLLVLHRSDGADALWAQQVGVSTPAADVGPANEAIFEPVASPRQQDEKAAKKMVVRVHELGSLLHPDNLEGSKIELQNALRFLDSRMTFPLEAASHRKESLSAHAADVPAAMFFMLGPTPRLIVRHTSEMQMEIEQFLAELRRLPATLDFSGIDLDARRK